MIKIFIISALVFLASSQWIGQFTVSSSTSTGSQTTFCDLPVVGSSSSIEVSGDTMIWSRQSLEQGTVTEPLDWASNEFTGKGCLVVGYCIEGSMDTRSADITLSWYLQNDPSDKCVVTLQPPSSPLSWTGKWRVVSSTNSGACNPPPQGSGVDIVGTGNQLELIGNGIQWDLNWLPINDNPTQICTDNMCATGNLTQQGATIEWVYNGVGKCSISLAPFTF